jgi:hypothetical protein
MPDPKRLLPTIQRAAQAFRDTPGKHGYLVELQDVAEVLIAGDLHGNLAHFSQLLKIADLSRHPHRHLVVQEMIHGPFRYDNGADKSHQLLDVLAALKCQFPRQVHFLLGNHELAQWAGKLIGKGDDVCNASFYQGVETAYGAQAGAIYAGYLTMLSAAALALRTPNRIFLSHSLPSAAQLETFHPEVLLQEELSEQDIVAGGSAHALVWGRDSKETTVAAFLQKVDADLLITGHLPCDEGFDTPNPYQLVLDCAESPAACCLFPTDRPLSLAELTAGVQLL